MNMQASATHQIDSQIWKSGVLNPEDHLRLVLNMDSIASRAGLGERYKELLWTPTEDGLLSNMELQWATAVVAYARTHSWSMPKLGIAYPSNTPRVHDRMRQITAKLLRNIVDCRVLTIHEILAEKKATGTVEGTAILCPDFVLPEYMSTFSDWDRKELIAFIKDRSKDGLPTSIYLGVEVSDLKAHGKFPSVAQEILQSFVTKG
jgi:hypothetical protein